MEYAKELSERFLSKIFELFIIRTKTISNRDAGYAG